LQAEIFSHELSSLNADNNRGSVKITTKVNTNTKVLQAKQAVSKADDWRRVETQSNQ